MTNMSVKQMGDKPQNRSASALQNEPEAALLVRACTGGHMMSRCALCFFCLLRAAWNTKA